MIACLANELLRAVTKDADDIPSVMKFINHQYYFRVPIVICVDYECLLRPVNENTSQF